MNEPFKPKKRHEGACDHCGSLDILEKKGAHYCRDCGAIMKGGEIVRSGVIELHYSLEVMTKDHRALWRETLDVLFEAQTDIAAGLKIAPGSSFTKWLLAQQNAPGGIGSPEVFQTLKKIATKMVKHLDLILDEHNRARLQSLEKAMAQGSWLRLSLDKR